MFGYKEGEKQGDEWGYFIYYGLNGIFTYYNWLQEEISTQNWAIINYLFKRKEFVN